MCCCRVRAKEALRPMSRAYRAGGLYRSGRGWPWGRGRRCLLRWGLEGLILLCEDAILLFISFHLTVSPCRATDPKKIPLSLGRKIQR